MMKSQQLLNRQTNMFMVMERLIFVCITNAFRTCNAKGNAKWNWCTSSQSNAYDGWVKQSWCLLFSFFLFLIKYYMTHLPFSKHTVSQARRSKQMKQWTYIISDVAERKRSRVLSYFMNTTNNKGKLWHRLHISNKLK